MGEVVTGRKKSASVFGNTEERLGCMGARSRAPGGGVLEGPLPSAAQGFWPAVLSPEQAGN